MSQNKNKSNKTKQCRIGLKNMSKKEDIVIPKESRLVNSQEIKTVNQ